MRSLVTFPHPKNWGLSQDFTRPGVLALGENKRHAGILPKATGKQNPRTSDFRKHDIRSHLGPDKMPGCSSEPQTGTSAGVASLRRQLAPKMKLHRTGALTINLCGEGPEACVQAASENNCGWRGMRSSCSSVARRTDLPPDRISRSRSRRPSMARTTEPIWSKTRALR